MMEDKIKRINELYNKQKDIGLTKEELEEQKKLRAEYIKIFKQNFKNTLSNVKIKDEKGNIQPLRKKK